MVRTFIAVELPEAVRTELGRVQQELRRLSQERGLPVGNSLKWVAPEGIHLTLKFTGEVPEAMIEPMSRAVRAAAAGRPALRLQLAGRGAFPNTRSPRVLWVGLAGELPSLSELQRRVDEQLGQLGFTPEKRPFSPHLTLARVREQASADERHAVAELLSLAPISETFGFTTAQVSLMKSELRVTGARYETLASAQLGI